MKAIIFFSVFVILFNACTEKSSNPILPDEQNDIIFSTLSDTIVVFPNSYKSVKLSLLKGSIDPTKLEMQNFNFNNFNVSGPWIADTTNKVVAFSVWGSNVSSTPESVTLPVKINNKTYNIKLTVRVSELYLIDRFKTNAINDTIIIAEGANFLLNVACIDTSNNVTPKSVIEPLGFGLGYGYWQNSAHLKFVVTSVNLDSIHYSFMFAAFNDISPNDDDRNLGFTFSISGKSFRLPIKIIYN